MILVCIGMFYIIYTACLDIIHPLCIIFSVHYRCVDTLSQSELIAYPEKQILDKIVRCLGQKPRS